MRETCANFAKLLKIKEQNEKMNSQIFAEQRGDVRGGSAEAERENNSVRNALFAGNGWEGSNGMFGEWLNLPQDCYEAEAKALFEHQRFRLLVTFHLLALFCEFHLISLPASPFSFCAVDVGIEGMV
tara:strand:- start:468 stop:848 length:381 start_codon:yes stop_codon:yes gene_type:complete